MFNARKPESLGAMLCAGAWYAFLCMIVWAVADRFVPGWSSDVDLMIGMTFFFGFGEMASGYRLARRDASVPAVHAMGLGLVGCSFVAGVWFFWAPPQPTERWWVVALALACFLAAPLYLVVAGAFALRREYRDPV